MNKSKGRIELEEAIINKVHNIFDNAPIIDNFQIHITGGVDELTTIKYTVEERIVPDKENK